MAFWKTAEHKAAEQQGKAMREADRKEQHARNEFLVSPVGQAAAAKKEGQGFFEIQLPAGSSQQGSTISGEDGFALANKQTQTHAGTLAAIESVGWRLEHVGYVFALTFEGGRDKFMETGHKTAVGGEIIGTYLFRNPD